MAKKADRKKRNIIIGVCVAVAIVIVVVVAIIIACTRSTKLDDSYFVSDDTKYVLTIDGNLLSADGEYIPDKTHLVYFYTGDAITGLKAYYEYSDNAAATAAYEAIKDDVADSETYAETAIDGKYIIFTANESEYSSLTKADVEEQIKFMEMLQNMRVGEGSDETVEIESETSEE